MYDFFLDLRDFLKALASYIKKLVQLYSICNPHKIIGLLCREYPYLIDPYFRLSRSEGKRRVDADSYTLDDFCTGVMKKLPEEHKDSFRASIERARKNERKISYRIRKKIKHVLENIWDAYATFRISHFLKKKMGIPEGKLYDELPDHLYPFLYSLLPKEIYDDLPDGLCDYSYSALIKRYRERGGTKI